MLRRTTSIGLYFERSYNLLGYSGLENESLSGGLNHLSTFYLLSLYSNCQNHAK